MKSFALAVTLSALACVPTTAAPKHHRHHHVSQTAAHSYAAQPQIACTVVGCAPVPRGCHPEMGYTPDGTPTGFDVAVCGWRLHALRQSPLKAQVSSMTLVRRALIERGEPISRGALPRLFLLAFSVMPEHGGLGDLRRRDYLRQTHTEDWFTRFQ